MGNLRFYFQNPSLKSKIDVKIAWNIDTNGWEATILVQNNEQHLSLAFLSQNRGKFTKWKRMRRPNRTYKFYV